MPGDSGRPPAYTPATATATATASAAATATVTSTHHGLDEEGTKRISLYY